MGKQLQRFGPLSQPLIPRHLVAGSFFINTDGQLMYLNVDEVPGSHQPAIQALPWIEDEIADLIGYCQDAIRAPLEPVQLEFQNSSLRCFITLLGRKRMYCDLPLIDYCIVEQPKLSPSAWEERQQQRDMEQDRREKYFAEMVESAPFGIFQIDPRLVVHYVNKKFCQISGLTPETAMGYGWQSIYPPESVETIKSIWEASIRDKTDFKGTVPMVTPQGEHKWVCAETRAGSTSTEALFGVLFDVTKEKEYEQELKRKNEELAAALTKTETAARARDQFFGTDSTFVLQQNVLILNSGRFS